MISQFAPAKINLYLQVTGKRDDGYHTLDSLIGFAEVGDQISVEPANQLSLSVDGPFSKGLEGERDNLVLRAANRLAQAFDVNSGAKISLTKNLPVASGIGGGSADAAATLKALCQLWDLFPSMNDLMELGLSLGADVPICLEGRPSFVAGIGEAITPAPPLPEIWMVLVNPGVAVSTPAVFKQRHGDFTQPKPFTSQPEDLANFISILKELRNDLTSPAIELLPEVGNVLRAIERTDKCLLSRMSGSGATCFGLYESPQDAELAARQIKESNASWWCGPTRLHS